MTIVSLRTAIRLAFCHAWIAALFILCFGFLRITAQTTLTGSSVADPAGPVLISPSTFSGPAYFVLNKDLSVSGRPNSQSAQAMSCPPPAGFSTTSTTPRTLINDSTNVYYTAQSSSANLAASTSANSYPCTSAAPLSFSGGVPTQTFATNDPRHGRYHVLEAFGGNGPDTLTVVNNLNTNNSSTPTLTKATSVSVDTGATYTSMLTDVTSDYGNTVITELRTSSSPGGLLVYSPGIQTVFRILGPGGTALPAIGAFFMPSPINDNGQLLVLINQDGLTAANSSNPPAVTNPFTIIDLGQLQRAFSAVVSQGTTITLPSVTQVPASTSYYAMFGAAYSPVFHLAYALVASGTSSSSVTASVIRYDPTNPSAPAETIVADVSNIPLTLGTYPQLALNAAAGTLEILSNGSLYHVSVAGKSNTAVAVTGSTFGDSNFTPTFIASNPLLGETYIASSSSVDILGLSGSSTKRATLELYGQDNAIANQSYTLSAYAVNPDNDSDLTFANVTFTATPDGGAPFTLGTGQFYQFTGANGVASTSVSFPQAGVYTVVATVAATANYPSVTSLPIRIGVGATSVAPVRPTSTRLVVPSSSNSTTVTGQLTLLGSTYAPSGRIIVSDANGTQVGRYNFTGGATSYPVNVTLTLPTGSSTLTATYNGDTQNQGSTSPSVSVSVGNQAKSSLGISVPTSANVGSAVSGTVYYSAAAGYTGTPTGNIVVQATMGGTTTTFATVPVSAAFNNPTTGAPFTFTAPAAGTYVFTATYAGDANFSSATSGTSTLTTTSALTSTATSLSGVTNQIAGTAFNLTVRLSNSSSSAIPSGTVTITGGFNSAPIATVTAAQALAVGGYQFSVNLPSNGTYTITANYSGDANFAASSGTLVINAKGSLALTNLYVPATEPIGNTITGTLMTKITGAFVAPGGSINVVATNLASGTTTTLATLPASGFFSTPNMDFKYTAPGPSGLFRVDATYAGDSNYAASSAPFINFNATGTSATATSITLSAPSNYPPSASFTTNVTLVAKTSVSTPPTGVITLTAISETGAVTTLGTKDAVAAIASGGGPIIAGIANPGTYTLKASYPGDANYAASSQTGTIVIAKSNVTLAISGPAGTTTGIAATYNVTVSGSAIPSSNSLILTSASGSAAGPQATLSSTGGTAVLTFTNPGTYTLTASLAADIFNNAASTTYTVVVTGGAVPGFTLKFDDPNVGSTVISLNGSGTVDLPFTLQGLNNFTGSVILSEVTQQTGGDYTDAPYAEIIDSTGNALSILPSPITPSASGLHYKLRLHGTAKTAEVKTFNSRGIAFAGFLFGFGLLGWRRRKHFSPRILQLLLIVAVIAGTGSILSGCLAGQRTFAFQVNASSLSSTAPSQAISVTANY